MGQGSPFAFGGAVIGGAIGSLGAPFGGIGVGAKWGATLGTLVGGIVAKPQDSAKGRDTRWGGVTYGTSVARGWGCHRTDAPIFWGVRNKDGTYLFKHNAKKRKKAGSTNVAHYRATFAFMILETGLTYSDDAQTQVERRIVVDRVWMADRIVWQSASAVPIPAWSSTTTYAFGDHVTRSGKTYASVGDANLNHTPPSDSDDWWQRVSTGKNYNLEFHPDESESTFTMAASSIMVSHDGVANTPAYRGCTYGLANDVDLYDLGNTLPWTSVSVEWHWEGDCHLRDLLDDACGLSGMPAGSYDFSALAEPLTGYRQTARQTGQDLIGSPLSIKGYDLVSLDGVVRAVKRGGSTSATIGAGELGATLDATPVGLFDEAVLADRTELHSSFRLGFYDRTAGFRQAYEIATRNTHPSDNPTDLASDLVMTQSEAAQASGYLLDTEHLEAGNTLGISLAGDRTAIAGADAILVPIGGKNRRYRVIGTEFVQNLVKLKLARDEPEVLNRHESGNAVLGSIADDGQIKPTALVVMSPKTDLSVDFARYPGFYAFVNGPEGWLGAQIVFTFDPPGSSERNWVDGPFVADASTFGIVITALPDEGGTAPTVPAAPTGLMATGGNAQVSLNWTASSGATSYSVKRSTVSGGPYAIVQTGLASTSFVDTGLSNGTAYFYVVTASNAAGESVASSPASATPSVPAQLPPAPTNVQAVGRTNGAGVTWTASPGAATYTVLRGVGSGTQSTVQSGIAGTSFDDSGLTNGTSYTYTVVAVNDVGSSSPSASASATPIAVPVGLTATAGNGQVSLNWSAAPGATGYNVKYGTTSGGPYGTAQVASGTSAIVSGLTNGTSYDFVVSGTNSVGESSNSAQATATPMPPTASNPKVPQGKSATFAPSGSDAPQQSSSWEIVYGGAYVAVGQRQENGWAVAFDGTSLTVSAPSSATIQAGYEVKFRDSGFVGHSALFDVVAGSATPVGSDPGQASSGA